MAIGGGARRPRGSQHDEERVHTVAIDSHKKTCNVAIKILDITQ